MQLNLYKMIFVKPTHAWLQDESALPHVAQNWDWMGFMDQRSWETDSCSVKEITLF